MEYKLRSVGGKVRYFFQPDEKVQPIGSDCALDSAEWLIRTGTMSRGSCPVEPNFEVKVDLNGTYWFDGEVDEPKPKSKRRLKDQVLEM